VDEDPVADLGLDQRPVDPRVVGAVRDHLPKPFVNAAVDDRLDVVFDGSKLTPLTASRSFGTTCHRHRARRRSSTRRTCAWARPAVAKKTAARAASRSARDPRSEAGVTA
jgi:hypothetical protein